MHGIVLVAIATAPVSCNLMDYLRDRIVAMFGMVAAATAAMVIGSSDVEVVGEGAVGAWGVEEGGPVGGSGFEGHVLT